MGELLLTDWYSQAYAYSHRLEWPSALAQATTMDSAGQLDRWFFTMYTMVVLETTFWLCQALYLSLDVFSLMQRFRIHGPEGYPSAVLIRECLVDIAVAHAVFRPVLLFLAYPLFASRCGFLPDQQPSWWTVLWQILVCMQIDDALFYWSHRLLHHRLVRHHSSSFVTSDVIDAAGYWQAMHESIHEHNTHI